MITRERARPLTRQAALLSLSRAALYYMPQECLDADLAVMRAG